MSTESKTGFVVPVYPYDQLDALVPEASAFDGGMVDLSVGEPAERPTQAILDSLSSDGFENNYPSSLGKPVLRDAARAWIKRRFDIDVTPGELSMCIGTKEFVAGVPHWLRLRSPEKDTVLYPAIAYPTYEMGALLASCRAIPVPARKDGSLALETISDEDMKRAVCLWVNSPSNPTGKSDDLEAAATFGRSFGVPVLSDECYVEFTWDGPPRTILEHGKQGVLAVHSISKRSNAAGLRVGFYAGDEELVHYVGELRRHAGFMIPTPVQMAGVVALNDDEQPHDQRDIYLERLTTMIDILATIGLEVTMPSGGFYLWFKVPERFLGGEEEQSPEWPFVRLMAKACGMLITPGEFFGTDGRGYVRIALVEPIEKIRLIGERLQVAKTTFKELS